MSASACETISVVHDGRHVTARAWGWAMEEGLSFRPLEVDGYGEGLLLSAPYLAVAGMLLPAGLAEAISAEFLRLVAARAEETAMAIKLEDLDRARRVLPRTQWTADADAATAYYRTRRSARAAVAKLAAAGIGAIADEGL